MDVLTSLAIYFKCSPKFNLSSENIPRCFWYGVWITCLLLDVKSGCLGFLILREKITSWDCLEGSGLRIIFRWYAQLLIIIKSLSKTLAESRLTNKRKKRSVICKKAKDLMTTQGISHWYRSKIIKCQGLNVEELLHLLQPI